MSEADQIQQSSSDIPSPDASSSCEQVERFTKRWTNLPRRDAPRSGPDAYLQTKYEKSLVRQQKTESERWNFTAKRRSMIDELDWLFSLSEDPRSHFMRLHERPQGSESCMSIVLRYAFACHLDRVCGEKLRNSGVVADLGGSGHPLLIQARLALRQQDPQVSYVVEQTCFRHPSISERILAHEMGLHHRTIGRRKWYGLRLLREWIEQRHPPLEKDPR